MLQCYYRVTSFPVSENIWVLDKRVVWIENGQNVVGLELWNVDGPNKSIYLLQNKSHYHEEMPVLLAQCMKRLVKIADIAWGPKERKGTSLAHVSSLASSTCILPLNVIKVLHYFFFTLKTIPRYRTCSFMPQSYIKRSGFHLIDFTDISSNLTVQRVVPGCVLGTLKSSFRLTDNNQSHSP